jgi:NADH-quinone oxidoreductase subunit E
MAWIVKASGTQEINRRAEPYLTDAMQSKLREEILPRYATKRAALLPALHKVQHEYGHLPYQSLEEVAEFLELDPADVLDTATFYEEFFLEPKGKYLIQICQSISCELCGHTRLLEQLQDKLGIEPGETTEDGRFTLQMVECLGSCGTAPVVMVQEQLHENVTWQQLERTLDELP